MTTFVLFLILIHYFSIHTKIATHQLQSSSPIRSLWTEKAHNELLMFEKFVSFYRTIEEIFKSYKLPLYDQMKKKTRERTSKRDRERETDRREPIVLFFFFHSVLFQVTNALCMIISRRAFHWLIRTNQIFSTDALRSQEKENNGIYYRYF